MLSEDIKFDLILLPAIFLWNAAGLSALAKAALGSSCPAEQVKWTMPWLFFGWTIASNTLKAQISEANGFF